MRTGGRTVVGELDLDPDYVSPGRIGQLAGAAGLGFGRQAGSRYSYVARLDVP